ncbi:MAG: 30S ribosomal protein S14 [Candidatus Korarchaeota archaeon NZ13-K]|nr:MAG: 30S ribosomal protein S14 [Candidatus Korarchaeota archaeon NZ13-K]
MAKPKKKVRTKGKGAYVCRRCGRVGYGIIRKYDLYLCRSCFLEVAPLMGWRKYE